MKKKVLFPPFLLLALFCGAFSFGGMNVLPQAGGGQTSGFLTGAWHGVISPISFFASFLSNRVDFVEANGNPWYITGFILGAVVLLFGGRVLSQKLY